MAGTSDFEIEFWGVRGSIACGGRRHARYGGNTSCVVMRCGGRLLIFDAGTGLRPLGQTMGGKEGAELDLFLTHTHFDHIVGLPFFRPLFVPDNTVRLWAGHLLPSRTLHQVLCEFMMAPLFPIPPAVFQADVKYKDFKAGQTLTPCPDVTVQTAPLNHPNGATGYRVEYDGRAACYITDTEHREGERDRTIVDLVRDSEVMIYDSSYTDAEYPNYRNWGHSTWEEGVRLANEANVGQLVLFHHDPSHDDDAMDKIANDAARARDGTVAAREGLVLAI